MLALLKRAPLARMGNGATPGRLQAVRMDAFGRTVTHCRFIIARPNFGDLGPVIISKLCANGIVIKRSKMANLTKFTVRIKADFLAHETREEPEASRFVTQSHANTQTNIVATLSKYNYNLRTGDNLN